MLIELLCATGLFRSSLYGRFGNKEAALRLAVERDVGRQILEIENGVPQPLPAARPGARFLRDRAQQILFSVMEYLVHNMFSTREEPGSRVQSGVFLEIKRTPFSGEKAMTMIAKLDLAPLTVGTASGAARSMLETARSRLGFVPNMYANMAHSPGLLATYLAGYEAFRSDSGLTPAEQEVVFLTISRFHGCTYCVAAHSMIADKISGVPADVLTAIRGGVEIPDAKLHALSEFTRILVESRGAPSPAQLSSFRAAGYGERQVLEIVLAIAVKVLSNYTNHLFHTATDPAFAAYAWPA